MARTSMRSVIFLCMLFLVVWARGTFVNLGQAREYIHQYDPYPDADNDIITNPDYTSFYHARQPTLLQHVLSFLGLYRQLWSSSEFYTLVKNVTAARSFNRGRTTLLLTAAEQTTIIVISNLDGLLHALVRILHELERQDILTHDLRLKHTKTYIIFNGNCIGNAAYAVETLGLILRLMHNNPENIIYIKGFNEDKSRWRDQALDQALSFYFTDYFTERLSVVRTLLRDFFNSLPLALYLTAPDKKSTLRISYYGPHNEELQKNACSQVPKVSQVVQRCYLNESTQQSIPVCSIFSAEDTSVLLKNNFSGLYFWPSTKIKKAYWTLFSAPSKVYRQKYRFFYDAFVSLHIKSTLETSVITLYHNNVRTTENFTAAGTFNLASGQRCA